MKRAVTVIMLCFFLWPTALSEELETTVDTQLDTLPLEELDMHWQAYFPQALPFRDMLKSLARGEAVMDGEAALRSLFSTLLDTFTASLYRMAGLMAPTILCCVMEKMKSAFSAASLGDTLTSACFLMLTAVMARDLKDHIQLCTASVNRMSELMQALFPVLLTLLAAVGSTASAAFFQPATVAASGMMCALVHRVSLPLATGAAVVGLLDQLSPKVRLTRLSALLKTLMNWTLGVGFTVFLSVTALQALGGAAADGVSLRTAKYMVDHFVPVVGGMFADTMDTLVGASLLIKNAVGVTGLVMLLSACARPMVQTLCTAGIYRVCAALTEPLGEQRISGMIHHFSQTLMMFFVVQLSVAGMFVLLTAQMLVVGQWMVMLR